MRNLVKNLAPLALLCAALPSSAASQESDQAPSRATHCTAYFSNELTPESFAPMTCRDGVAEFHGNWQDGLRFQLSHTGTPRLTGTMSSDLVMVHEEEFAEVLSNVANCPSERCAGLQMSIGEIFPQTGWIWGEFTESYPISQPTYVREFLANCQMDRLVILLEGSPGLQMSFGFRNANLLIVETNTCHEMGDDNG